jgi:hypothetical protein
VCVLNCGERGMSGESGGTTACLEGLRGGCRTDEWSQRELNSKPLRNQPSSDDMSCCTYVPFIPKQVSPPHLLLTVP